MPDMDPWPHSYFRYRDHRTRRCVSVCVEMALGMHGLAELARVPGPSKLMDSGDEGISTQTCERAGDHIQSECKAIRVHIQSEYTLRRIERDMRPPRLDPGFLPVVGGFWWEDPGGG